MEDTSPSWNLVAKISFHVFCHILLVRIMSLASVCTQGEKIIQMCEYQEARGLWEPYSEAATTSPKAVFGKFSRNVGTCVTIILFAILD